MRTKEYSLPEFEGPVIVHHEDDWTGDATIEWQSKGVTQRATVPAIIIQSIATSINRSQSSRSHHARDRDRSR